MLDWILANLKLVVFVIIILVYAIKAMRTKGGAEDESPEPTRRVLPGEDDEAEAQRTREIQEEIRRRILARQRGETPVPAAPEVMEQAPPTPAPPPLPPPVPVQRPAAPAEDPYDWEQEEAPARDTSILEAQRALDEQWRQVRLARELATAGVPRIAPAAAASSSGTRRVSVLQRALREDLHQRDSLRRAILLREVLGEPVGLRRGPAGTTQR